MTVDVFVRCKMRLSLQWLEPDGISRQYLGWTCYDLCRLEPIMNVPGVAKFNDKDC